MNMKLQPKPQDELICEFTIQGHTLVFKKVWVHSRGASAAQWYVYNSVRGGVYHDKRSDAVKDFKEQVNNAVDFVCPE